jgi:adenylate cyclase
VTPLGSDGQPVSQYIADASSHRTVSRPSAYAAMRHPDRYFLLISGINPSQRAWALMALGQMILRFALGRGGDDGLVAAGRALALDANLAEAHAVKARILADKGRHDEASAEIDIALGLNAESYEVNRSAAYLSYRQEALEDAICYWEKATTLLETDINSSAMLLSCYVAGGDSQAARRCAHIVLTRAEKALTQDPNNGAVTGYSAYALAALGRPNAQRSG